MTRDLLVVGSGNVIGSVTLDGDQAAFGQYAGNVLAGMRRQLGDLETAREVIADGWSNGAVYFGEARP